MLPERHLNMRVRGGTHSKKGGICLKTQKGDVSPKNQQKKTKTKKKGRIARVYRMHHKGLSVKEIAEKKLTMLIIEIMGMLWLDTRPQARNNMGTLCPMRPHTLPHSGDSDTDTHLTQTHSKIKKVYKKN